jgi:hypothetical protein
MRLYNDPLTKVLHLFSPLRHMSSPLVVREDLLIETDIGCFGIAYSKSTNTAALFYARDPDAFEFRVRADGARDYLHKDRLSLVKMYPLFHRPDLRWDHHGDTHLQIDFAHVDEDIHKIMGRLPRAQIRETCLHRTRECGGASVFVAYRVIPSETVPGEYSVSISTKSTRNFQLLDNGHDDPPEKAAPNSVHSLFRRAHYEMMRRGWCGKFLLRAVDPETGKVKISFTEKELPEVIETNFSMMQQKIWDGVHPVRLSEQPIWPVLRAGGYIANRFEEFEEDARKHPMRLLHNIIAAALELKDFGIPAVARAIGDIFGDTKTRQSPFDVPPEWRGIIKKHERHFNLLHSALHDLLARPDPAKFGDLSPISPQEHVCNFAHAPDHLAHVRPADTFNRWLRGLLLAPYDGTFEYRGKDYALIHPAHVEEARLIHMYAANGIVLHYMPESKQLYAYYHRPDHIEPNHHLHTLAHTFFKAGQVLRIDASHHGTSIFEMPFEKFEAQMRAYLGKPDLRLPSADHPERPEQPAPRVPANENRPAKVALDPPPVFG